MIVISISDLESMKNVLFIIPIHVGVIMNEVKKIFALVLNGT